MIKKLSSLMLGIFVTTLLVSCGGDSGGGDGDDDPVIPPPPPTTAKLTVINDFSGQMFNRLYLFKTGATPSIDFLAGNAMFYGDSYVFTNVEPGVYTMHAQFINAVGGSTIDEYRDNVTLKAGESWIWYLDGTWGSICYVGTLEQE